MKTHTRRCKDSEQPCKQEHTYYCALCAKEFETEESTFHKPSKASAVLPSMFWPVCSLEHYRSYFSDRGDTNPNIITWKHLGTRLDEGIDPDEPIDFLDGDDQDILAAIDLEYILDTNPEEDEDAETN